MTTINNTGDSGYCQDKLTGSPLAAELEEIFSGIPYKKLLKAIILERVRAFSPLGRLGYPLESLLKGVLASYYIGLKSTAQIVRRLQEDPTGTLPSVCGFKPDDIPHRATFSRFIKKLRKYQDLVDECLNQATSELKTLLPGFGEVVAIDSTPVRSHSNPWKEPPSDPEAGKIAKGGSGKDTEWHWGYRLQMIIDATHGLPISKKLTPAKSQDVQVILPFLRETKRNLPWFDPDAVIADKGYDSKGNFEGIVEEFDADPIIAIKGGLPEVMGTPAAPTCPARLPLIYRGWDKEKGLLYQCPEKAGKAVCPMLVKCGLDKIWVRPVHDYRRFGYRVKRGTEEWKRLYRKRVTVEQVNSRLKQTRRLEDHCFRGFERINVHCTLSVLVMQALALAKARAGQIDEIRVCVRQVG